MTSATITAIDAAAVAASISQQEYHRLLSLPRNYTMEGDMLERAENARAWYAQYGQPIVASVRIDLEKINPPMVSLKSGHELQSDVLAKRLQKGEAHSLMILAVSAGQEVSKEVATHWAEGRPDEGFFLDRFAVAVVEYLVFNASQIFCRSLESKHETLMQHLSPGCGEWDISDQHKLMELLTGVPGKTDLGPLKLLNSGAIDPQHSVLAVLGVTHGNFAYTPVHLCRSCDLNPCEFRRAPYRGEAVESLETR
jgi:hypothetical protein